MAVTSTSTRLGCGRDIDEVWQHLDAPPDAHELTCPYCQAARADLADLATAAHELRRSESEEPDDDPALVARVLDIARAEVRRGRRLPLDEPDPAEPTRTSTSTVSEQAVGAVVRRVGDALPGVEVGRCSARPSADPTGVTVGEAARVEISLDVTMGFGLSAPALTRELREQVRRELESDVGLVATRVDIVVRDVLDD